MGARRVSFLAPGRVPVPRLARPGNGMNSGTYPLNPQPGDPLEIGNPAPTCRYNSP
jgi:hypothetical protein